MNEKLPHLKADQVISVLEKYSFAQVSQHGSHQKWHQFDTGMQVIVPYHKGKELPLIVILGLLSNAGIWIVVIVTQPFSRWMGFAWMAVGILVYYLYRRVRHIAPDWQVEREKQPRL